MVEKSPLSRGIPQNLDDKVSFKDVSYSRIARKYRWQIGTSSVNYVRKSKYFSASFLENVILSRSSR